MLKRRASKRFVLAETGEVNAWDTTMDNDRATPGRRESLVDGVPPQPSVMVTPSTTMTTSSSSSSSNDSQGTITGASSLPDVANNPAMVNSGIVDGTRLSVDTQVHVGVGGASLK